MFCHLQWNLLSHLYHLKINELTSPFQLNMANHNHSGEKFQCKYIYVNLINILTWIVTSQNIKLHLYHSKISLEFNGVRF